MASRITFSGASTDVPWINTPEVPEGFGDQYARLVRALLDASALPLTDIGGTADDVTATCALDLPGYGLIDGMKFTLTWAEDNTGPLTLALNGGSPVDVLDSSGGTLAAGAAAAGMRSLLEYIGGAYRILGSGGGASAAQRYAQVFTASGIWSKPAGLPDDTPVTVEMWGGGGGGSTNATGGGGGGGAYARQIYRIGDLPASVSVGIGSGGSAGIQGGQGGNTTFGALLTAYGGGGGDQIGGAGGGGGGEIGAGVTAAGGGAGTGGRIGGGRGGRGGDMETRLQPEDARTIYGGAGGGAGVNTSSATNGAMAVYGGGGGGGGGSGVLLGGTSVYGGRGGDKGSAGQAPAGGGGQNAAGARGEVRIWI